MDVWLFLSNGVWRTADAMMVQGMGQSQDRCLTNDTTGKAIMLWGVGQRTVAAPGLWEH